jgi:Spy/CpxP family protein refolding chaperone
MNSAVKMICALCLFILAFGAVSQAQTEARGKEKMHQREFDPEKAAERQTVKMTETLGLTDKQVARVKVINLEHAKKMQALKAEAGDDREAARERFKALKAEKEKALNAVFTKAQKEKYEALKAERKARHEAKKGHGRDGKGHPGKSGKSIE